MNGKVNLYIAVALFVSFAVVHFVFFPDYVHAASSSIGVSPSQITNDILTPGAEYETKLTISRASATAEVIAKIEISGQEISSWVTFPAGDSVVIAKGEQRKEITVKIKVPQDAAYRKYEGSLRFTVTQQTQGQVNIVPGVRVDVKLTVTDKITESIKVLYVQAKDSPLFAPYHVMVKVKNLGNAEASPTKLNLLILDINEKELRTLSAQFSEKVAAFSEKDYDIYLQDPTPLSIGEYWARVTVFGGEKELYSDKFSFRITDAIPSVSVSPSVDKGSIFASNILMITLVFVGILTLVGLIAIIVVFRRKNKDEEGT